VVVGVSVGVDATVFVGVSVAVRLGVPVEVSVAVEVVVKTAVAVGVWVTVRVAVEVGGAGKTGIEICLVHPGIKNAGNEAIRINPPIIFFTFASPHSFRIPSPGIRRRS